ncbi:copper amine oxidase N-terminal domain-containing protein [Aminipila butyrica]|uniref:Copper amine oxidase N-terminal domain-containing protein n=1 Tax=Aminipila butyrica TaxID=433296 RepID=A0A858BSN5_9FIRM|nr:copper amine oxidase N-terminal domain-containing protein [Aminipila butyrica]QIB68991.1 copper amine oxidase N-terminal domain-containing protein [Aminipila butyrica]
MRRRIAAAFLAVFMVLTFPAGMLGNERVAYGAEKTEIKVIISGTALAFSQEDGMGVPFIDSTGRTQVPVRKVLEKIGATVAFETDAGSGEKNIILSKDEVSIKLTAGSLLMRVNTDIVYQMDTSPQIVEGRTYMPLRAVLEVLGYNVAWENTSKTIGIERNPAGPVAPVAVSLGAVTPVGQFTLPADQSPEEDGFEVLVNHGYIYYIDKDYILRQTTFSDLTKSKKVYDCSSGWVIRLFNDENNTPRLYFHTEGASMGSPHQFLLNTDGSMKELNRDYAGEVFSAGGRDFAFTELKFGPDYLEMKNDQGAYATLGGRDNQYKYRSEMNGFNGRHGVYLLGDELYLLGQPAGTEGQTAVYRINMKTDEAVSITEPAYGLQIEGNYLYYNTGKEIRKRNLQDGTETSMYNFFGSATDSADDFAVLNGNLYLIKRWSLFAAVDSTGKEVREGEKDVVSCSDMALRGDEGNPYLVCQIGKTDTEKNTSSQWLRVYDKDGKVVLEREGEIDTDSVSIEGDKICYYNKTTKQINVEKIK